MRISAFDRSPDRREFKISITIFEYRVLRPILGIYIPRCQRALNPLIFLGFLSIKKEHTVLVCSDFVRGANGDRTHDLSRVSVGNGKNL